MRDADNDQIMSDATGEHPEEDKTNSIPIANFKSNKLSHIDKRLRAEEFERLRLEPGSPGIHDAIRLPNKVTSQVKTLGDTRVQIKQQEIMSPTQFFGGIGGKLEGFFH